MKVLPSVSVIIPVYSAERYMARCSRSLFGQTMESIEYIFVDDCSPDNSIDVLCSVLSEFPHRKDSVKIISHERNQGVSKTRYDGIKAATGEYVIHCDADDWVELDMYESLYREAVNSKADIVYCDVFLHFPEYVKIQHVAHYKTPQDCIEGYYKKDSFFFSSCNKLVKRALIYEHEIFPPLGINLGEDVNMMFRQLHYAKILSYCDRALYHYDLSNTQSITHSSDVRSNWEMGKRNTDDNVAFLMAHNPEKYQTTASFLKFTAKLKILRANPRDTRLFYDTYKDCRKDVLRFTCEPLRVRLLYFCMLYSYVFLKLYQWIQTRK